MTLVLSGRDDQGSAVDRTVTSDGDGSYRFTNLRPGSYTVTEPTQPPGTVNGRTTAGTVNGAPAGTATPPSTTPSAIAGIALPAGGASIGNDFAEIGDSSDLLVFKASVEARFTIGNVGTYSIRVRNGGEAASSGAYRVADRLPAGLTLDAPPSGTGWACTGAAGATSFVCTSNDALAAAAANPNAITARVRIGAGAASPAINAVLVDGGGELPLRGPTPAETAAFDASTRRRCLRAYPPSPPTPAAPTPPCRRRLPSRAPSGTTSATPTTGSTAATAASPAGRSRWSTAEAGSSVARARQPTAATASPICCPAPSCACASATRRPTSSSAIR